MSRKPNFNPQARLDTFRALNVPFIPAQRKEAGGNMLALARSLQGFSGSLGAYANAYDKTMADRSEDRGWVDGATATATPDAKAQRFADTGKLPKLTEVYATVGEFDGRAPSLGVSAEERRNSNRESGWAVPTKVNTLGPDGGIIESEGKRNVTSQELVDEHARRQFAIEQTYANNPPLRKRIREFEQAEHIKDLESLKKVRTEQIAHLATESMINMGPGLIGEAISRTTDPDKVAKIVVDNTVRMANEMGYAMKPDEAVEAVMSGVNARLELGVVTPEEATAHMRFLVGSPAPENGVSKIAVHGKYGDRARTLLSRLDDVVVKAEVETEANNRALEIVNGIGKGRSYGTYNQEDIERKGEFGKGHKIAKTEIEEGVVRQLEASVLRSGETNKQLTPDVAVRRLVHKFRGSGLVSPSVVDVFENFTLEAGDDDEAATVRTTQALVAFDAVLENDALRVNDYVKDDQTRKALFAMRSLTNQRLFSERMSPEEALHATRAYFEGGGKERAAYYKEPIKAFMANEDFKNLRPSDREAVVDAVMIRNANRPGVTNEKIEDELSKVATEALRTVPAFRGQEVVIPKGYHPEAFLADMEVFGTEWLDKNFKDERGYGDATLTTLNGRDAFIVVNQEDGLPRKDKDGKEVIISFDDFELYSKNLRALKKYEKDKKAEEFTLREPKPAPLAYPEAKSKPRVSPKAKVNNRGQFIEELKGN